MRGSLSSFSCVYSSLGRALHDLGSARLSIIDLSEFSAPFLPSEISLAGNVLVPEDGCLDAINDEFVESPRHGLLAIRNVSMSLGHLPLAFSGEPRLSKS